MTINQHLDNVFYDAAKRFEDDAKGVLYNYKFYNSNIMCPELIASGAGYIIGVRYDRGLDCNVYTLEDATTKERYTGNQFRFELNR